MNRIAAATAYRSVWHRRAGKQGVVSAALSRL